MADRNARIWTGTSWESISSPVGVPNAVSYYQGSAPASPSTGTVWIDSNDSSISVWNGSSWIKTKLDASNVSTGTLAVARGGTGTTSSTGTGSVVLSSSPSLAGTPTAPTASAATNNTQIATTAFVKTANSGNVIQTVVATLTTTYTRGSASAIADVTGFSAAITPKFSNSKVLILIQGAMYAICDGYWYIKRNGTQVGTLGSSPRIDFVYDDPSWFYSYLDSPATTSSITYQLAANATGCGQGIYVNSQGGISRMILMEVQA